MNEPIFEFQNVTKRYSSKVEVKPALANFSFKLFPSTMVGIFGPSGSGKTTAAKLMKGLIKPTWGTFLFHSKPISYKDLLISRQIQLVHQNPYESLSPKVKVLEMLLEPLRVFFKLTRELSLVKIMKVCHELSISEELLNRYPSQLSGGEKQRIALLRALLVDPELLICDEIVSSLDAPIAHEVLRLLKKYQVRHDLTVIFISHDLQLLESFCDQVALIYDGKLISYGSVDQVVNSSNHPFILQSKEALDWLKN